MLQLLGSTALHSPSPLRERLHLENSDRAEEGQKPGCCPRLRNPSFLTVLPSTFLGTQETSQQTLFSSPSRTTVLH